MNISVLTWGTSPGGEPTFLITDCVVTDDQYVEGEHYDEAQRHALQTGMEPPFVHIDENDARAFPWLFVEARKTDEEWQARAWERENC